MFLEVTGNKEQKITRDRLRDVMEGNQPIEMISDYMVKVRSKLRENILKSADSTEREELLSHYHDSINEFYRLYVSGMTAMHNYSSFNDMKALAFLSMYTRYRIFFEHVSMSEYNLNTIKDLKGTIRNIRELLLSGWDVIVYKLSVPLHDIFDMQKIDASTVINETDWDGTKPKKGLEIIRRNGESGGKVFAFVYIEETNEGREQVFHFYSINVDGDEMRHYEHKVS